MIHSIAMEELLVIPAICADTDEYIADPITSDELVARARARHGLNAAESLLHSLK